MIFKTEIGFGLCKLITYQLMEVPLKVDLLQYAVEMNFELQVRVAVGHSTFSSSLIIYKVAL